MGKCVKDNIQESLVEWAEIDKCTAIRMKKDERIVRQFCAENTEQDIMGILELLEQYKGMSSPDQKIVVDFKQKYPKQLDVKSIADFLDVKDLYSQYLESGGKDI